MSGQIQPTSPESPYFETSKVLPEDDTVVGTLAKHLKDEEEILLYKDGKFHYKKMEGIKVNYVRAKQPRYWRNLSIS